LNFIDLRSDTVTQPTAAMRRAMAEAEVGDDGWGDDPTVIRLVEMAAERMGKEAALYMPSGTMCNLVATLTHCGRGEEMIVGSEAHMFFYELGGSSGVAGVHVHTVPNDARGRLDPADVAEAVRPVAHNMPRTALVSLENTHNRCSGAALTPSDLQPVIAVAKEAGAAVHLDGARIFNAAIALGLPPRALTEGCDTVSFCLSKGLSAPVGSLLCGTKDFIGRARKNRRMVGGGMRQAGVIAAAGVVALETMVERLAEDHANAKRLAEGLAALPGIALDPGRIETNIVIGEVAALTAATFAEGLAEKGTKISLMGGRKFRMVTHHGITSADIDRALAAAAAVLGNR
jgi:threonine aldolase